MPRPAAAVSAAKPPSSRRAAAAGTSLSLSQVDALIDKLTDGLTGIKDDTGEFLLRLPDGRTIDTKGWDGWDWTHGVALTALFEHHTATLSAKSLRIMKRWYAAHFLALADDVGPTGPRSSAPGQQEDAAREAGSQHPPSLPPPRNINTTAALYGLACVLELPADSGGYEPGEERERLVRCAGEWGEWVMDELPRTEEGGFQHVTYDLVNEGQLWDDTLMMTVIPLAKLGLLLDRPRYIEEAKNQFVLHTQYLLDPRTGLWFHGWQFEKDGEDHNFAEALWARGNCWVTLAIPLFLQLVKMPSSDSTRQLLEGTFRRQVSRLSDLQDPTTGLWHTLLDDPSTYVETSATAGFAAGLMLGIRTGLIEREIYLSVALRALQGVLGHVDAKGEVGNCSFGTAMGNDLEHYRNIPLTAMPYGQALTIWALVEYRRLAKPNR